MQNGKPKGDKVEKYVLASGLYWIGIILYFVYSFFIYRTPKGWVEFAHKELPAIPFSDKFIFSVFLVVVILASFVWPITIIIDVLLFMKGNTNNDE